MAKCLKAKLEGPGHFNFLRLLFCKVRTLLLVKYHKYMCSTIDN